MFRVPANSTSILAPLLPHPVAVLHFGARTPHGVLQTGISRESYEEKLKRFVFACTSSVWIAWVDADENRIAELKKDNIVRINRMSNLTTLLGLNVGSTLARSEKSDLVHFAECARVCYIGPNGIVAVGYGGLLTKLQLKSQESCIFAVPTLSSGVCFCGEHKNCVSPS